MSDPTKKSIIINQSFLSGSNKNTSSPGNNKLSKKNRPKISDEIIKPNKLKKILLDKINAKRKADQTSASSAIASVNNNVNIDISKESKIFSNEFKKSMDFLDNYINTKNQNPKIKRANDNLQSKTLKRQNIGSGNLTTDILKSIQNSKHSSPPQPQRYPSPVYSPTVIQSQPALRPQIVIPNINVRAPSPSAHIPAPVFQKIQLQLPQPHVTTPRSSHSASIIPTQPRINLEIGKNSTENMIYTELPPELQPTVPSFQDMNIMSNMSNMSNMSHM